MSPISMPIRSSAGRIGRSVRSGLWCATPRPTKPAPPPSSAISRRRRRSPTIWSSSRTAGGSPTSPGTARTPCAACSRRSERLGRHGRFIRPRRSSAPLSFRPFGDQHGLQNLLRYILHRSRRVREEQGIGLVHLADRFERIEILGHQYQLHDLCGGRASDAFLELLDPALQSLHDGLSLLRNALPLQGLACRFGFGLLYHEGLLGLP